MFERLIKPSKTLFQRRNMLPTNENRRLNVEKCCLNDEKRCLSIKSHLNVEKTLFKRRQRGTWRHLSLVGSFSDLFCFCYRLIDFFCYYVDFLISCYYDLIEKFLLYVLSDQSIVMLIFWSVVAVYFWWISDHWLSALSSCLPRFRKSCSCRIEFPAGCWRWEGRWRNTRRWTCKSEWWRGRTCWNWKQN